MKPPIKSTLQPAVALYGGSFDPVHSAHLQVARAALGQVQLDKVVFIPAAQSPLKSNQAMASDADRIEMLRLVTADEPQLEVDTREIERGGSSYTVDTVIAYLAQHEGVKLYWILGADQFELLSGWRRIEDIASKLTFIVLRRPGYSTAAPLIKGLNFVEVDAPLMKHSSSEIRHRIAEGLAWRDLLPLSVEAFICSKGLYTR